MAQVPYPHVEAPRALIIGGVRAFNVGDAVPLDTARRLGLLSTEDHPPILPGTGGTLASGFTDAEIKFVAEEAASAANVAPAPEGAGTTPTPPQAPVKTPPKGSTAATSTP